MFDQNHKNRITRITRVGTMLGVASILALAAMSNAMAYTKRSGWHHIQNEGSKAEDNANAEAQRLMNDFCRSKGGWLSWAPGRAPVASHDYHKDKKGVVTRVRAVYTYQCDGLRQHK